jgi:ribosomal protein S18 acetylase RimI-like enzyme
MEIIRLGAGDEDRLREVRLRALADAPKAFASTYEREEMFSRDVWTARLTDDGSVNLLAVGGGSALGMTSARIEERPGTAHLLGMWVAPEARGRGVGRRLIDAIVEWAREREIHELGLWVTDANDPARALYGDTGFRPTGERQPLPSDPSIMESRLVRDLGRPSGDSVVTPGDDLDHRRSVISSPGTTGSSPASCA